MQTLDETLSKIADGWKVSREISERAVLARSHARKGHKARAEEYAAEIDAIQRAVHLKEGHMGAWDGDRTDGILWRLSTEAWADMAVHGVYLSRYITTPFGTTQSEAEAWVRRVRRSRLPLTIERVDAHQRAAA